METVIATAPVFRDLADADHTLGIGRDMRHAINAGYVERDRGERWFAGLAEGPFYASFTLVTVICSR